MPIQTLQHRHQNHIAVVRCILSFALRPRIYGRDCAVPCIVGTKSCLTRPSSIQNRAAGLVSRRQASCLRNAGLRALCGSSMALMMCRKVVGLRALCGSSMALMMCRKVVGSRVQGDSSEKNTLCTQQSIHIGGVTQASLRMTNFGIWFLLEHRHKCLNRAFQSWVSP